MGEWASPPSHRGHATSACDLGATAGPFTFSVVGKSGVVGGNEVDREGMAFSSTFHVENAHGRGTAAYARERSADRVSGRCTLRLIWPWHSALMGRVLRAGAHISDLRQDR